MRVVHPPLAVDQGLPQDYTVVHGFRQDEIAYELHAVCRVGGVVNSGKRDKSNVRRDGCDEEQIEMSGMNSLTDVISMGSVRGEVRELVE